MDFSGFITGINYWASKNAIKMWEDFDEGVIEEDFKQMKAHGITHLRIFPVWSYFQPLSAICVPGGIYELRFGDKRRPDTEAGNAGVSEEACRRFSVFCDLADKYGLKLIVGLITGQMSFRLYIPDAFVGKNAITDPYVVRWEIKLVKYFVKRFMDRECISAWDLGNEPDYLSPFEDYNTFYLWCTNMYGSIKAIDSTRPVISGFSSGVIQRFSFLTMLDYKDYCDINTTHPYACFTCNQDPLPTMKPILSIAYEKVLSEDISKVPTFIQEFGAIGYSMCSYKTEADFYRATLLTAIAHSCKSAMYWCAYDQGDLDYPPYDWNDIGSEYGFFTSEREVKPVAKENIYINRLLDTLENRALPEYTRNAVVLLTRETNHSDTVPSFNAFMLAKRAGFDVSFSYLPDMPIPDSRLYIIPSYNNSKGISLTRFNEILDKVNDGAILYISLNSALMRKLPYISGVDFSYRENVPYNSVMSFNGIKLNIGGNVKYTVESVHSEIIAADSSNEPIFFKNKHGKGYIYILLAPLEAYIGKISGYYNDENQPDHSIIYKELANAAGIERIAKSNNKFVLLTEHKINDNEYYIFPINYSNKVQNVKITLNGSFDVETVFGCAFNNGEITLRENDGCIFKVKKL